MSYTAPNLPLTDNPLDAQELHENFEAFRDYTIGGIDTADVVNGSLMSRHVARPEFYEVGDRSGGAHYQTGVVARNRLQPLDSVVKVQTVGFRAVQFTPNGFAQRLYNNGLGLSGVALTNQLQPLNKSSCTIRMESSGYVKISVAFAGATPYDYRDGTTPGTTQSLRLCIGVDGAAKNNTRTRIGWQIPTSQNAQRLRYRSCWAQELDKGEHTVSILAGVESNLTLIGMTHVQVEVYYTAARDPLPS